MQAPPRGPPRGGAGDGSAAIVNGWVYALVMRTSALRVSVGAYSSGVWHVALIIDHYERGVLINSEIESLSHPETEAEMRWNVKLALDKIVQMEQERIALPTGG